MIDSSSALGAAFEDFAGGIQRWRLAYWMASKDMKGRYERTVLGPYWSVLSNALFVLVLGVTYGAIFRIELHDFLPYLAASLAFWNFINGVVNDATTIFPRSQGTILTFSLPLSIHAHRLVIDKLNMLLHFLLIYAALCIFYPPQLNISALLIFPALLVYYVFGIGTALLLGVIGVRWRDLTPAVSSLMLLVFLITPILWKKTPAMGQLANLNPFFHLLEIGRGPLQGYFPTIGNWTVSLVVALLALVAGVLVFSMRRRQIFYWI